MSNDAQKLAEALKNTTDGVWVHADRDGPYVPTADGPRWLGDAMTVADGRFFVEAHNRLPSVLADLERLTTERAALLAPVEGVDLEEVLRLDREGTAGPWDVVQKREDCGSGLEFVESFGVDTPAGTWGGWDHNPDKTTAQAIATYRTAAPALAREVARLRADNADLLATSDAYQHMHTRAVRAEEEVERLRALLGAEQTRAETYNEEHREVVSALEDAGQLRAGKDPVAAVRAVHADVQRLQDERAKLEALAAELFDGVPTSPENALTWLHQEVMKALTTPNWPGALVEILMERVRQIEKGYTAEHDDKLTAFELSTVAAAVTLGTVEHLPVSGDARELTGHIIEKWDIRRRLVIAAALVVAEIERLDRKQGGRTA